MTTLLKPVNGILPLEPGTALLGEVITWACPGIRVRHLDLVNALRDAGLEESVARELAPRHAFTRAGKKLAQARIIRQVSEDESTITFQFTRESREGDNFQYELETLLSLDENTGKVSCPLARLATLAQEHLDEGGAPARAALRRVVDRIHRLGRRLRLYEVPERPEAWGKLMN